MKKLNKQTIAENFERKNISSLPLGSPMIKKIKPAPKCKFSHRSEENFLLPGRCVKKVTCGSKKPLLRMRSEASFQPEHAAKRRKFSTSGAMRVKSNLR
jgi:hypothetical protein